MLMCFVFLRGQDMWRDSGEIFSDNKQLPLGSIIHIVFSEKLVAQYRTTLNQVKSRNRPGGLPKEFDFLPQVQSVYDRSKNDEQTLEIEHGFQGQLAASISGFDPNTQTYLITANQQLSLNDQPQRITLSAQVFFKDIGMDRQVASTKLANLRVSYRGLAPGRTISQDDFDYFNFSPGNTNAVELKEAKKREYYLEFFKLILDQLF